MLDKDLMCQGKIIQKRASKLVLNIAQNCSFTP